MIGRLTGRVAAQEADGGVVLDVGGVGYELAVPMGTLGRVRADETGRITLWVYTHVREDALSLFGFADEQERAAFRALLGVSNVGPKIAVAVLGAMPLGELARAVARRDLAAMTSIPGIGKKTAERLLLELRDKLPMPLPASPSAAASGSAFEVRTGGDRLRGALTGMGFKPGEADRAIAALAEREQSADRKDGAEGGSGATPVPFEDRLREALALLAK
jgi:holliday junction DNA helicase RuvA